MNCFVKVGFDLQAEEAVIEVVLLVTMMLSLKVMKVYPHYQLLYLYCMLLIEINSTLISNAGVIYSTSELSFLARFSVRLYHYWLCECN